MNLEPITNNLFPWPIIQNLLVIRPDNMGDVLMMAPAFRMLKTSNPHIRLTLLASPQGAEITPYIPDIDAVIPSDVPWVKNNLSSGRGGTSGLEKLRSRVMAGHFDAAIILTSFSQSPLPASYFAYEAGIPVRAGYCRENPYALLTHWIPDPEPFSNIPHEIDRQIGFLESLGAFGHTVIPRPPEGSRPDYAITPSAGYLSLPDRIWDSFFSKFRRWNPNLFKPFIVVHPGVSEKKRQFPPENFRTMIPVFIRTGYQVILTGSAEERLLTEFVADGAPGVINTAGDLTVGELAALISVSDVLVSNNTGPVHIASAVGTPVVVTYARTNPQHTPWGVAHRVLYFGVPEMDRSRNTLLRAIPDMLYDGPEATPEAVIMAVSDLFSTVSRSHLFGREQLPDVRVTLSS